MMPLTTDINNKWNPKELFAAFFVFTFYAQVASDWFYNSFTFYM